MTRHGGALAPILAELLLAAGPADRALAALAAASLPQAARDLADRLAAAVAAIRARAPALRLTIDPVEFRGFRYETGVSVTIYAPGRHEELGRGGRYVCGEAEPATGLTLLPDAVLRAAPQRAAATAALCAARRGPGRGCADARGWAMPPSPRSAGRRSGRARRGGCGARISCATAGRPTELLEP